MKKLLFSEKWLTKRAEVIQMKPKAVNPDDRNEGLRMTGGEGLRALAHPRNDMVMAVPWLYSWLL